MRQVGYKLAYDWLLDHLHNPYPSVIKRTEIGEAAGFSRKSIDNWFIEARKYIGWNALRQNFKTRKQTIEEATRVLLPTDPNRYVRGLYDDEIRAMVERARTMFYEPEEAAGEPESSSVSETPREEARREMYSQVNWVVNTGKQAAVVDHHARDVPDDDLPETGMPSSSSAPAPREEAGNDSYSGVRVIHPSYSTYYSSEVEAEEAMDQATTTDTHSVYDDITGSSLQPVSRWASGSTENFDDDSYTDYEQDEPLNRARADALLYRHQSAPFVPAAWADLQRRAREEWEGAFSVHSHYRHEGYFSLVY
ncbi:hypothetical protein D9758_008700 [Tetrapyrgos nigripes]|uniref:KN homeodomain domain-containing protein n=1 Tax=Tetrapyrgos nigripes TaxID=182062 RepID=A0A8H5FXZ6_9AGAR|nr:hypothetical protein D9758_017112 [Tetrapyrgos nigripes]KAF5353099.1 hypothetical protein D9758_008700 [Tetrapyrgos nigripes]